jgi:hypothetical protein
MPNLRYILTRDGVDISLDVEYEVAAYDPGNSYGPPENCEPPSGGEITELIVAAADTGESFKLTDAEESALEQHIYDTHDYSGDGFDDDDDWGGD